MSGVAGFILFPGSSGYLGEAAGAVVTAMAFGQTRVSRGGRLLSYATTRDLHPAESFSNVPKSGETLKVPLIGDINLN